MDWRTDWCTDRSKTLYPSQFRIKFHGYSKTINWSPNDKLHTPNLFLWRLYCNHHVCLSLHYTFCNKFLRFYGKNAVIFDILLLHYLYIVPFLCSSLIYFLCNFTTVTIEKKLWKLIAINKVCASDFRLYFLCDKLTVFE